MGLDLSSLKNLQAGSPSDGANTPPPVKNPEPAQSIITPSASPAPILASIPVVATPATPVTPPAPAKQASSSSPVKISLSALANRENRDPVATTPVTTASISLSLKKETPAEASEKHVSNETDTDDDHEIKIESVPERSGIMSTPHASARPDIPDTSSIQISSSTYTTEASSPSPKPEDTKSQLFNNRDDTKSGKNEFFAHFDPISELFGDDHEKFLEEDVIKPSDTNTQQMAQKLEDKKNVKIGTSFLGIFNRNRDIPESEQDIAPTRKVAKSTATGSTDIRPEDVEVLKRELDEMRELMKQQKASGIMNASSQDNKVDREEVDTLKRQLEEMQELVKQQTEVAQNSSQSEKAEREEVEILRRQLAEMQELMNQQQVSAVVGTQEEKAGREEVEILRRQLAEMQTLVKEQTRLAEILKEQVRKAAEEHPVPQQTISTEEVITTGEEVSTTTPAKTPEILKAQEEKSGEQTETSTALPVSETQNVELPPAKTEAATPPASPRVSPLKRFAGMPKSRRIAIGGGITACILAVAGVSALGVTGQMPFVLDQISTNIMGSTTQHTNTMTSVTDSGSDVIVNLKKNVHHNPKKNIETPIPTNTSETPTNSSLPSVDTTSTPPISTSTPTSVIPHVNIHKNNKTSSPLPAIIVSTGSSASGSITSNDTSIGNSLTGDTSTGDTVTSISSTGDTTTNNNTIATGSTVSTGDTVTSDSTTGDTSVTTVTGSADTGSADTTDLSQSSGSTESEDTSTPDSLS